MEYDEQADFDEKQKFVQDLKDIFASCGRHLDGAWQCLEIGGEGGVLCGLMAAEVGHVVSTDIVPLNDKYDGAYLAKLSEKFARRAIAFPMRKIDVIMADAQRLPFRDRHFDFCLSQNAFEHIPDPEAALREAFRVTKLGGLIYVQFDPVWTADSGSHFIHRIGEPWRHLLESDEAISGLMTQAGADGSEISAFKGDMNRLPATYYLEMFPRVVSELGGEILIHHQWEGCVNDSYIDHPNRRLAAERLGLDPNFLLIRGFRFLIRV